MQTLLKQSIIGGLSFLLLTGIAFSVGTSEPSVFEGQATSEEIIYSTGFESAQGFTAGTTYNNTSETQFGPVGSKWGVIMGTPTTTDKITDSQSLQMRSYASPSAGNNVVGRAYPISSFSKMTKVVFSAKASVVQSTMSVEYSLNNSTWSAASLTGTYGTTLATITASIPEVDSGIRDQVYFRINHTLTGLVGRLTIDGVSVYGMIDEIVTVESITVTFSNNSIVVGGTSSATATVLPANATNKTVSWSSSNLSVATVNASSGVVTGVAAGTANIIATAQDGSAVTGQAEITVTNQPVTGIVVSLPSPTLAIGSNTTATATISPANATNKTISWSSLSTNIATINSSTGVITGVALGTSVIRATAQDGSGITGEETITVANNSLYRSFNFLNGGDNNNGTYSNTNLTTNVSYATDNPTGTSGTTAWEADYANLNLTTETRLGGQLVSTVQTDDTTAWSNIKSKFTFDASIDVVKIFGAFKFGTAGNTTKVYLQSSFNGTTWTTVQELNPPAGTSSGTSSTLVFDGFTIAANSYVRIGVAVTASGTNSGLAFTKLSVNSYTLC
jgi:uncharacterized protein YjdB